MEKDCYGLLDLIRAVQDREQRDIESTFSYNAFNVSYLISQYAQ